MKNNFRGATLENSEYLAHKALRNSTELSYIITYSLCHILLYYNITSYLLFYYIMLYAESVGVPC